MFDFDTATYEQFPRHRSFDSAHCVHGPFRLAQPGLGQRVWPEHTKGVIVDSGHNNHGGATAAATIQNSANPCSPC